MARVAGFSSMIVARLRSTSPGRLKSQQLLVFTTYLEIMTRCGMNLVPALAVLSRGGDPRIAECSRKLVRDVESGMRFSQALSRQPESFSGSYIRVIQTAEATGRVEECLRRLVSNIDKENQTTRRVFGALFYPVFLVAAASLLVAAMLYFVFPMVIKVTQDAGVDPPQLTRTLIWLTSPRMLLISLGGLGLLATLAYAVHRHPKWGPACHRVVERYTPFGRFYVRVLMLRSIRQLAMLLDSGVEILKSLTFAGQLCEDSVSLNEAFQSVIRATRAGETLSYCIGRHSVFPPLLSAMISVSDQAGDTHRMLAQYCDVLEDQLNGELDTVTALLEPLLLATMGIVIGVILLAAFMPIYNLIKF